MCAKMADCAQIVPVECIEVGCMFGDSKFKVMVADDVVPIEN